MKFIVLTSASDHKLKLYVSVNKITCVYELPSGYKTIVYFGHEDDYVSVQEKPERIMQMIKDVTE